MNTKTKVTKVKILINTNNTLFVNGVDKIKKICAILKRCIPVLTYVNASRNIPEIIEIHKDKTRSYVYNIITELKNIGLIETERDDEGRDVPMKVKDYILIRL